MVVDPAVGLRDKLFDMEYLVVPTDRYNVALLDPDSLQL